ncbi:MAG: hypothetical protein ABFS18_10350 [Thermodesulfobacteriota bacterium]
MAATASRFKALSTTSLLQDQAFQHFLDGLLLFRIKYGNRFKLQRQIFGRLSLESGDTIPINESRLEEKQSSD